MAGQSHYTYHPARRLVQALCILLLLHGFLCLVAAVFGWEEVSLLQDYIDGAEVSDERAESSDERVSAIGLAQTAVLLPLLFVFGTWIHRANRNARSVSSRPLHFTPGGSIGWYFVPIANLWKPYQAMREIWTRSYWEGESAFHATRAPRILGGWWFLWLASSVLGQMSFRLYMRAEETEEYLQASRITLASDLVDIALAVVAFLLVRGVSRTQASARVERVFE